MLTYIPTYLPEDSALVGPHTRWLRAQEAVGCGQNRTGWASSQQPPLKLPSLVVVRITLFFYQPPQLETGTSVNNKPSFQRLSLKLPPLVPTFGLTMLGQHFTSIPDHHHWRWLGKNMKVVLTTTCGGSGCWRNLREGYVQ